MHLKWQQNYFTSSSSWIWNTVKREWNLIRSNLRKSDLKHETMCPFSSPGSFGTHGKSSAEWKTLERNHQLLSQMNTDTVLALKVCWEQTPFIVRKQRKRHKVEQQIMRNNQRYFYTRTRSLSKQWKTTAQWPTESKQGDQVHFILRWCPTFMSGYSFSKDRHFWHTLIKSGFHPAAVKRQQEGCHHGVVFCCKSNKLHKREWK